MDYTSFQKYPINIIGISERNNAELTAIEEQIVNEIDYSGDVDDLVDILPFFVYFRFCESRISSTTEQTGESITVKEFTETSFFAMCRAWNIGAKKLTDLCAANAQIASSNYQSKRSLL